METTPIIFLDIDGVLNNQASLARRVHLLPDKALLVSSLRKATGSRIVVSSAWRRMPGLEIMLYKVGISWGPLGFDLTPYLDEFGRGKEIDQYLEEFPESPYVILEDDTFDLTDFQKANRTVDIDFTVGFDVNYFRKAIAILRNQGVEAMSTYLIYTEGESLPLHHQMEKASASPEEVIESLGNLPVWLKPVRIENVLLGFVYKRTETGWIREGGYQPLDGEERLL